MRIPADQMQQQFMAILLNNGFTEQRAETCASIFTGNSVDGVYTHGVNRFAKFIEYIRQGVIRVNAEPEKMHSSTALEQWNGNLGPGPLNAIFATDRVIQNAGQYGIACLALANTNHWMRGGAYGWRAAKKGFVLIAWTNTTAILPAWGAKDSRLGNNPIVFAFPYQQEAIVLDMAMSQFSYGIMELKEIKGEKLPMPGGYDSDGQLTQEPTAILKSLRALPMGYWKGAGFALLLDILATTLSAGFSVKEISGLKNEHAVSQVFIAIDIKQLMNHPAIQNTVSHIINDYLKSVPMDDSAKIVYPGQRVLKTRKENVEKGIPVDEKVWDKILQL